MCESVVGANAEVTGGDGIFLDGLIELELLVCYDRAGSALLIEEFAVIQGDDGVGVTGCNTL